jgi:hypothetical protein
LRRDVRSHGRSLLDHDVVKPCAEAFSWVSGDLEDIEHGVVVLARRQEPQR